MKMKKLLLASVALMGVATLPAQASIVDNPHFKVLGLVIVWGSDGTTGSTAPIASDFIINSDSAANGKNDQDLIAGDVHTVVTGSLQLTSDADEASTAFGLNDGTTTSLLAGDGFLDASDTLTAFDVTGESLVGTTPTYESSFYVASNTAFNIEAVAAVAGTPIGFDLTDIGYELDVTVSGNDGLAFGGAAQDPTGTFPAYTSLDDLTTTAQPVFNGTLRTASSAGTIAAQSVRFDATYTLGTAGGYDLSMGAGEIQADVTYTVYVP